MFINTEAKDIIGLSRHDDQVTQNQTEDSVGYELRRFLQLLRKTNSAVLEILFNENWITLDKKFEDNILANRSHFLDTEYTFKSICGYIQGEKKLMLGDGKTGKLGSKRKMALDTFGYSYKNYIQLIRLCFCARIFFEKGYFPVNIQKEDSYFRDSLYKIKKFPNILNKQEAEINAIKAEEEMKKSFDGRDKNKDYHFNEKKANEVILDMYYPYLEIDYWDRRSMN